VPWNQPTKRCPPTRGFCLWTIYNKCMCINRTCIRHCVLLGVGLQKFSLFLAYGLVICRLHGTFVCIAYMCLLDSNLRTAVTLDGVEGVNLPMKRPRSVMVRMIINSAIANRSRSASYNSPSFQPLTYIVRPL